MGDLADVQQAVQAGEDGDEGAELDHLGDLAQVGLANLSGLDEVADHLEGNRQLLLGGAGDLAEAVVVDVHFAAADLDDAADGGAALADDVADLLLGELDAVHLGGIAGVFGAGHGQHLAHEVQQVQTADLGLVEGLGEDLGGDAADLDVHLQGGDAPLGAGDLKVHVAVVVFLAGDVGQHHELVAVADEAHGHAGHGGLELDAGIHEGEGAAADGGHRRRAIALGDVRHHAHGVGVLLGGRQHREDAALGQHAVADLAPSGPAVGLALADAVAGEVVVQVELLAVFLFQAIDDLGVLDGAQGGGDQGLGLAAGEEAAAVGRGQDADLDVEGADLVELAAVQAHTLLEDGVAEEGLLQLVEAGHQLLLQLRLLGAELGDGFLLQDVDGLVALDLHLHGQGREELLGEGGGDLLVEVLVAHFLDGRNLGLADLSLQLLLELDQDLDLLVAEGQGLDHVRFLHFLGAALDHHQGVGGAGHQKVDVAVSALLDGGVHHQLAVDAAHADAAHGVDEGDLADDQGRGGAHHGEGLGGVLAVIAEHLGGDHGVAVVALFEEGAQGAVDEAAGEGFLGGLLALALEPAAGDLASGEDRLAVVHGEGEEVDAFPGGAVAHGHEDHGVALADDDSAVGLLGDAAGLEGDGRVAQVHGHGGGVELQCVHEVSGALGPSGGSPGSRAPARFSCDRSMKPVRQILNQEGRWASCRGRRRGRADVIGLKRIAQAENRAPVPRRGLRGWRRRRRFGGR